MKKDLPFESVFYDATRLAKKIPQSDYLPKGYYPILDQGKKYISGYYNDNLGLFSDVPAIIFGDHTRIIKFITSPCFIGADGVKLLKFKTKDNPKYLYYALQSLKIPNTGYNRHFRLLKEAKIRIWPKNIQEKIVLILDKIKSIIENKNRQIENIDIIAKSRFIEMFGEKDFPKIKIGNEFLTTSGGTPSSKNESYYKDGTIPWLTSGEVNKGIISVVERNITKLGLENSTAKIIPANCVVVAMYGATAGKVGLLRIKASTNQAVCAILPNEEYNPIYLYYAISQKEKWMISQTHGGAQPNISQNIIKNMEILKPPISLQNEYANTLQQLDKSKFRMKKCLRILGFIRHL